MFHTLIVRANFNREDLFQEYLKVAKKTFFPSIHVQTNKNFTICFTVNPKHKEIIRSFVDNKVNCYFFNSLDEIKEYLKNKFYEIQTRHDFDDLMRSDYIRKIQLQWFKTKNLQPSIDTMLIQSQPNLYIFNKNKVKNMNTRYSKNFTSMHLSLCQKTNKHFIFDEVHHKMHLITKNIKLLPNDLTRLVIHNNNRLSKENS